MESSEITNKLTKVFRDVFGDQTLCVTPSTTAQDVPGWDSLMHINLIVALEKEFKIRFTTREIATLRNVGDLIDLFTRKESVSTQRS